MKNKKGTLAIAQILLLIVGIIAISWGAGVVSAAGIECTTNGEVKIENGNYFQCKDNFLVKMSASEIKAHKESLEVAEQKEAEKLKEITSGVVAGTTALIVQKKVIDPLATKTLEEFDKLTNAMGITTEKGKDELATELWNKALENPTTKLTLDTTKYFTDSNEYFNNIFKNGLKDSNGKIITDSGSWNKIFTKERWETYNKGLPSGATKPTYSEWKKKFRPEGFVTRVYNADVLKVLGSKGEKGFGKFLSEKISMKKIISSYGGALAAAKGYVAIIGALGASDRNVQMLNDFSTKAVLLSGTAALLIGGPVGWIAAGISVAIMGIATFFGYKLYSQDLFTYQVQSWQPQDGGEMCRQCNDDLAFGCSEYQCHTYGQGCQIVNPGTTDELCDWINADDNLPPTLTAMESELIDEDYSYTPSNKVSPGGKGVKISYSKGEENCVPPFSGITLGVETNEPAECKIDIERKAFDEMISHFKEGSARVYNHTLFLPPSTMPSSDAVRDIGGNIVGDRDYVFYIRCKDTNGNINALDYVMEFCVEEGPDLLAPVITDTSYGTEAYIQHNITTIENLKVYTNEPADCRWDFQNYDYKDMKNNMTGCSDDISEYFNGFEYGCNAEISGIKADQENKYYIKCMDQPWWDEIPEEERDGKRNENKDPFILTLTGTRPLVIENITINGEGNGIVIKDSTDIMRTLLSVKTIGGANEGRAKCKYSINEGGFFNLYSGGSFEYLYENTQGLDLPAGFYGIDVECWDEGLNFANGTIDFALETDTRTPQIVRVYKESDSIKIITDEEATCVYSLEDCNYGFIEGIQIDSLEEGTEHFLDWDAEQTVYTKCEDIYGNQPLPQTSCTLIVKGSDDY